MDFTNASANNEEDLQDEDFYYDEEDSVEEWELFKHNVDEGNEILSTLIKKLTDINQCLTDPANRCLTDV